MMKNRLFVTKSTIVLGRKCMKTIIAQSTSDAMHLSCYIIVFILLLCNSVVIVIVIVSTAVVDGIVAGVSILVN